MALTFKEKIFYQDQAESSLETLNKENLSIKEKVATQDRLTEALEKLDAGLEEPKAPATLYERIMKGEFNSLPAGKFIFKVNEALEEVESYGLPEAKACLKQYVQAHYDAANNLLIAA